MGLMSFGRAPSLFGNNGSNCVGGVKSISLFGRDNDAGHQDTGHSPMFHFPELPVIHLPVLPTFGDHHDDAHHDNSHDTTGHGSNCDNHSGSGDHGGSASNGTGFPAIPADTSGVTFFIAGRTLKAW